ITFFETGTTLKNSLFLQGGINDGNGYYSLGYSQNNMTGVFPNSNIDKYKLSFSGAYNLNEKLRVQASIDYTRTKALGRSKRGYSTLMSAFRQWWEVNVDILAQKKAFFENNNIVTWNPTWTLTSDRSGAYFWNNVYFQRYRNYETDQRDNYVGYAEAQYDVAKWLSFTGRVSYTGYTQLIEQRKAVGSPSDTTY